MTGGVEAGRGASDGALRSFTTALIGSSSSCWRKDGRQHALITKILTVAVLLIKSKYRLVYKGE